MYDDLVQVREGAKRIFATVLEQREKLIYDYVLVPFHDPEIGPLVRTTDTNYFQRKLQNLYVQGGGDCPEMSIGGIKLALEKSLPASFIYVFTDARSKDYHLVNQVLDLIQQKQSQVVFVMTGDCGNRTHAGYVAYERIASASSGQIFHLDKADVNEVLNYVRKAVQTRKVNIVSLDLDGGGNFVENIPVDSHLYELTISLTGQTPEISLMDPDRREMNQQRGVQSVLDLSEVAVVSIKNPKPGIWQLRHHTTVLGGRKHTLRVYGIGAIDFAYGFAPTQTLIDKTHRRPLRGAMTYMMINMTGLPAPGVATTVALVDAKGKSLYDNPLAQDKRDPHLYYVGPFVPPQGEYFVKVNGIDEKNYEFQRISMTTIRPESAGGPRVSMPEKTNALVGQSVNLTCYIQSRAPYEVRFFKGESVQIGGPLFFKQSDTAVWLLTELKIEDRGDYRCVAISGEGNHSSSTFVETTEPPPHIVAPRNVTVTRGSTAYLHCRTQTIDRASITWQRRGGSVQSSGHLTVYPNGTLRISQASKADEGPYVCNVITRGGVATAKIFLTILEPPKAIVDPGSLYFVRGGSFNMSCQVRGDPVPEAVWYFQGRRIRPGSKYYITYKYDLIIRGAGPEDAGQFECRAQSSAGQSSDTATARLAIPPKVKVSSDREMIGRGDRVTLECQVTEGTPTPSVRWYRGGREITAFRYISINGGRLTIQGAQDADAGMYTCVAENMAGRAEGRTRVDVGSIPSIVPSPETVTVNIERDITLQCRATGHPIPEITWKKDGYDIATGGRYQILPDGGLLIRRVELDDQSRYTCTATNRFGRQDAVRQVLVTGLISPVLGHVSPEEQVIQGTSLRLSCVVVLGTPKPTVAWYKNNRPVRPGNNVQIESEGSGLLVRRANPPDEAKYTCVATNAAGNATININVQVISKPVIEKDQLEYVVNEESRLVLTCKATGRPDPTITWNKDNRPLFLSSPNYSFEPDGSLIIFKTILADAGRYTCTATNAAGNTQRTVSVAVRVAPSISPDQTNYNVIQGRSVTFGCAARGDPNPSITWYKDGRRVGPGNPDGTYEIRNAKETDRGEWKCVAANPVGTAERVLRLSVHTAPVIDGSGEMKVVTVIVNQSSNFPCPARADPPPTREWTYEGRRVFRGYSYGSELRFTGEGTLEIMNTQMRHAGTYRCLVSNLAGNDSITYLLKVLEPPRIISDIPGTIDVVLNLQLELPCRALGTPKPEISWRKDGFEILARDKEIEIDPEGTLRIEHSQLTHAGEYTCTAKNTAGEDSRVTTVVVQEPPFILPSTPTEYTVKEKDPVSMTCIATGSPKPEIQWYRRGVQIEADHKGVELFPADGRLVILSVKSTDHGPYICKAINEAGEANQDVLLTVIVPPNIPDQGTIVKEEVLVGGPFSLYCPVFSTPIPTITWQLNGRPIAEGDPNIELSEDKRRLHILKSRTTDAGVYKCIARNEAGESSKTFEVEVLVPPNLDESQWKRKLTVIQNNSITINCPVTGIPDPDINWLANGQLLNPGPPSRGLQLSDNGRAVVIDSAQLDHEGAYTCMARNKAGSLDIDVLLTVLSLPNLGENEVIELIKGQTATMNCDFTEEATGTTITWLKVLDGLQSLDNVEATTTGTNIQEAAGGRRLYVLKSDLPNQGIYSCIVRNSAGESRKNFELRVLVPPEFRDKDFEQNLEVKEGNPLLLSCHATGHPKPKLTWERNGEKLSINSLNGVEFTEDDQVVRVQNIYNGRSIRFTCMAKNKAGSISRDFFVEVLTPPTVSGGDRTLIEVIKGHSRTLECPVASQARGLEFEWLKDGRKIPYPSGIPDMQISLDQTQIHMVNVQEDDQAVYTCVAKNRAGQDTHQFDLVVLIPPSIIGQLVEDVTVIEGQSLNLKCNFEAVPVPSVRWRKDGYRLPERAQILSDNTTVYVGTSVKEDAGRYICTVINKAGNVEKTFNVRVITRPVIQGSDQETTVEVLIRTPVTLECPVVDPVGVNMSWLRHGEPVEIGKSDSVQVLAGGRHLHLPAAQREDAGRFLCVAKNEAGQSTKRYNLVVLIPPSIIGEGGKREVIENQTLTMLCESDGIPTPTIAWTKDGGSAQRLPNTELLSENQHFRITQAIPQHEGGYLCTATNKVGTADLGFDVDVITKPSVGQAKETIEVIVNQSANFRCPVTGSRFEGDIIWLRDGRPLDTRRNQGKYQISLSNRKLHLSSSQLSDEGNYACRIKNRAGETTVGFKLIVLEPPKILILDKDKSRNVTENGVLTLSCPASGKPDPEIEWYKDGEKLEAGNIEEIISGGSISGNTIQFPRIQVSDSGRFTCTATNKAGMAEQDITVFVMTKPYIETEGIPSKVTAILGRRTTIPCPAFGRPDPTVMWLKDGRPLRNSAQIYTSASNQKLNFIGVTRADLGRYTCVAENAVGQAKRDFTVEIHVAPSIAGTNIPRNIDVVVGRSAMLQCPATGFPEPTISWLKNGQTVRAGDNVQILDNGRQIQISNAQLDDTARYTCIASNDVGAVDQDTFVNVIGPPRVTGRDFEVIEVVKSQSVSLDCSITGTEPLEFEWYRGAELMRTANSEFVHQTAQNRILQFLSARTTDEGRYTCKGSNTAGEARKTFELKVLVPPVINDSSSSPALQSVAPGESIRINCKVHGIPQPQVTWLKDDQPYAVGGMAQLVYDNQTLVIRNGADNDEARYTCRATNKVGSAEKDFVIQLKGPPQVDQGTVKKEVLVDDYVILTCRVTGGTGQMTVNWLIDGTPTESKEISPTVRIDDRRVEIREARLSDTARYTCVVTNEAGEARKHFDLTVLEPPRFLSTADLTPSIVLGRPLILDCSVTGTPKPTLIWRKDGVRITEDATGSFLNDERQYRIDGALEADAGRYSCVAENKAGRAEKDMLVDVLMPPTLGDGQAVREIPENDTATLECPVNFYEDSMKIQWSRNGVPISTSPNVQQSASNRKLHIIRAKTSNAGRYTCAVSNAAGDASMDTQVIVLVPPTILGPGFRTMQTVVNRTVEIRCDTTGIPSPTVTWTFDGSPLLARTKVQLLNNGSLLRLSGVQTNQEGRYSCIARNKIGEAEADTFLEVIAPPQIAPGAPELKVIEGQGQTIHCEVLGSPTPTVTWLKNGRPFDSALVHSSSAGHYIHVVEALREDAARYTCVAKNDAGEDRRTTTLTVLVPPTIEAGERVLNVIENRSLQIEAIAEGLPDPILTWSKDGDKIDASSPLFAILDGRLTILKAQTSDAGRYTVEAKNEAGTATVDFAVDVYLKPKFRDLTPEIRVIEGNRATIECKVDAKPKAEIRWLKAGRPLDNTASNMILSPRGEKLMILDTRRTDAGSFSCVAKNAAGESEAIFTVTVLVAPYIEGQLNQNPKVVLGSRVTVGCPVQGIPQPDVEWKKNGSPLTLEPGRIELAPNDKDLIITEAEAEDDARYTCHAENEAGLLDTDFALKVIAPPKFGGGITEYKVIRGDSVTLKCDVEAEPAPEITWLKGEDPLYIDRQNMWFSGNKQELTITQARLEDGGGYTCEATNVAGKNQVEMVLSVLVPPEIDKSNIIGNPLAIVNKSIVLECPATGIPSPTVRWQMNGQPLLKSDTRITYSDNNQTIKIDNVKETDVGRYVCIAENEAGSAEQEFNLEVMLPPRMDKSGREKITVTEGEQLIMTCPVVVQEPTPDISWTKDGRPIDPLSLPNMRLSSESRRLHVTSVKLQDAGVFTCVGSNRAGETQLEFEVEVLSPPEIDGSRNEPQPKVIIGREITLWCMVSGNPFPEVAWYKDGDLLTPTQLAEYTLLEESQGIRVNRAEPRHAGRYTCRATNEAGMKELDIPLDVWVPPTVSISGENFVAPLQASITLKCQAAGNPPPSLMWMKNSQALLTSPTGARISGDGARVDIPRLTRNDVGTYTCTATNPAGVAEASVEVDVLVPPSINRDNIDMNPRLPAGQTLTLACEATGKPEPELAWYQGEEEIAFSNNNLELTNGGRFLQISNIALADKGVYKCVASNTAGTDEILYNVEIVEKPIIEGGRTIQVVEGRPAKIECVASGTPPPEIWWQRNGQRIETRDRYVVGDNSLEIQQSRSQDAGIYVCVATNNVGSQQQAYTLEVLVPPKIVDISPPDNNIPLGQQLKLLCGARGYPDPEIEWFRDGVSLQGNNRYIVDEDGTLTVNAVNSDDRGTYRCIGPPIINSDGTMVINVTQGDPTALECNVKEPIPEIAWYKGKNSVDLYANPTMSLESKDRHLKIGDSRLTDAGDYRCVAINPAGNATQRFRLNVGVPPRITEEPRRIVTRNGSLATLPCEALGVPEPEISWTYDSEPVPETYRNGNNLKFSYATPENAGVYTCQARNWAGTGYKDIELVVQIPPKIIPERMNVTVKENVTVTLECNATGIPEPKIEWFKEPNVNIIGGQKYQLIGSSLKIKEVKIEDDSFYRCLASNEVDVAVGYRRLIVDLPKKKWKVIWVQCDDQGRPVRTLFKPARGDVTDEDGGLLPYGTEFLDLPENGTEGTLIRCLPNRNDTNKPAELSKQPVITELPKNQEILPGGSLSLTCAAIGSPTPEILWSHNGTLFTDHPPTVNGKSSFKIQNVGPQHAGLYGCLARNPHGSATSVASVTMESGEPQALMLEGALPPIRKRPVAVLSCASDEKDAFIYWTKGGRVVTSDSEAKVLSNGSLVVFDSEDEYDLGRYKCVVSRKPGSVTLIKAFVTERKPEVMVGPTRLEVQPGATIYFHCRIDSDMLTTRVAWFHNSLPVVNGPNTYIYSNNTLELQNVGSDDRGVYKCVATNSMGQGYDEASLVIQGSYGWSEWASWSVCSQTCDSGRKTRFRYCHTPPTYDEVLTIPDDEASDRLIDGSGWDLPANVHYCYGSSMEEMSCNNHPCPDMPSNIHGYLQGKINNVPFGAQAFHGNVTPVVDNNQIYIKIDTLPLEMSPISRATLGYVSTPCWMMAYPNRGGMNGFQLTNGHMTQQSQYRFQTGETLDVKHNGMGLDSKGYLVMDILVDGGVPSFPRQQIVTLDPVTEEYVQVGPGHVQAYGKGKLKAGPNYEVPFSWHHNITYDDEAQKTMPTPAASVRIEAVDLTTENSFTNKNFGYLIKAAVAPRNYCPPGFNLDPNTDLCFDRNECEAMGKFCSHGCSNTPGDFHCSCPTGMKLSQSDPYNCFDLNECRLGTAQCKEHQECINTMGSYRCSGECKEGYRVADNGTCVDLNECRLGIASCSDGQECVNTLGSYQCLDACMQGYRRSDDGICQDVDECRDAIPCHPDRTCMNIEGSYQCLCQAGFVAEGPNGPCRDVDECERVPAPCSYGCRNAPGSYFCYCAPGSTLLPDGKSCGSAVTLSGSGNRHSSGSGYSDFDGKNMEIEVPGAFGGGYGGKSGCPTGQIMNDDKCEDIDECRMYRPCQFVCQNTFGSYHCSCPAGYRLNSDGHTCLDIDECSEGLVNCGSDSICFNEKGGHQCIESPCPDMYTLNAQARECRLTCHMEREDCPPETRHKPSRIQIQLLTLPRGLSPHTDLLRLTAYDSAGQLLRRTRFTIKNRQPGRYLPFVIRLNQGVGTLYTSHALQHPAFYQMGVRANSFANFGHLIRYQKDFLIFISVSRYPF